MLTTSQARERCAEVAQRLRVVQDEANSAEALLIAAVLVEIANELPGIEGFYYENSQEYDDENYYMETRVQATFEDIGDYTTLEAWESKDAIYGWSEGGCQALFGYQEDVLSPNDLRLKLGNAAVVSAEASEV